MATARPGVGTPWSGGDRVDVLTRGGIVGLRLFPSLAGYRRGWLQGDGVAGLTVWAMLIPQALAYARSQASRR
jgi:hypothetical protein